MAEEEVRTVADDDAHVLLNGVHGNLPREVVDHHDRLALLLLLLERADQQADIVPRSVGKLFGISIQACQ